MPAQEEARQPAWRCLFGFTVKRHRSVLVLAILVAIASGAVTPILSILLGKVVDQFTTFGGGEIQPHDFQGNVSKYCAYLAFLGSGAMILNATFYFVWLFFGELQAKSSREMVFEGLSSKSAGWYDLRASGVGGMLSRIQTQIRDLQTATSQPLGQAAHYATTAIASILIAFYYCWKLAFVVFATIPISALILGYISARTKPFVKAQQSHLATASKIAQNAFNNIETVKCFNGQEAEVSKYTAAIALAAKEYFRQAAANSLQIGIVRLVILLSFVQGFWFGHHLVSLGSATTATTATVITTFYACLTATQAIEQILPQLLVLEKGRAAGAFLRNILSSDPLQRVLGGSTLARPSSCQGCVKFHGVSFAYPSRPSQLVLRNFTGSFDPSRITIFVGQSGSGKSTISQLILGFYSTLKGRISLDEQPIDSLDPQWLRANVTLVEQHSVLFQGSLGENIALGGAPESVLAAEDIQKAAQFALLQQTVHDLPQGFDTAVDARGTSLSGGQRQKVALARARIRDTPILILDESTSALDQTSRVLMLSAIRSWRRGRTTIVITHDWSQIEASDYVYVLKNGETIKEGLGSTLKDIFGSDKSKAKASGRNDVANTQQRLPSEYQSHLQTSASVENILDMYAELRSPTLSLIPSIFAEPSFRPQTILIGSGSSALAPDSRSFRHPRASVQTPVLLSDSPLGGPIVPSFQRESIERPSWKTDDLLEMTGAAVRESRRDIAQRVRAESEYPASEVSSNDSDTSHQNGDQQMTVKQILRTIWPSLGRKSRLLLLTGLGGVLVHATSIPIFSWVFSRLLSTFVDPTNTTSTALKWALSIVGIAFVDALACFSFHLLLEFCGQVWVDVIRKRAVRRIIDQPREWMGKGRSRVSEIMHSLDRNAEEMRNLLGRFLAFSLTAVIMMAASMGWSLATCYELALVGLAVCPASFLITRGFRTVSSRMEEKCNSDAQICAGILEETFNNVKTVRGLTLERIFRRKYKRAVSKTFKTGIRRAAYCGVFYGLSEALIIFAEALIFYYGAVLSASGAYSVDKILLVFSMLVFSLSNLSAIVAFVPQIESSRETASHLLALSNLPESCHENIGSKRISEMGSITCRRLCFGYSTKSSEQVLSRVDLTIPAGKATALVGPSGSGKSTIASLILRLLPTPFTQAGSAPQITIKGHDINSLHTPTLRSLIGTVPQTPVLFPATIAENIAYAVPRGSPDRTLHSICTAARAAGIHEFIMSLPQDYDTLIGDGGIGLSGGQAQRLAIARALVQKPRLLILDEATSALDPASAALVRDSVRHLVDRGGMTVLIVTHAREMMEIADRVVMLHEGRVVEEGRFEELLGREGGKLAEMLSGGIWRAGREKADDGLQ